MDKSRENIGWKSMAEILDREMPKDRKRRFLPLLFLLLVSSTLAGFWGYYIGKGNIINQQTPSEISAESPVLAENVIDKTEAAAIEHKPNQTSIALHEHTDRNTRTDSPSTEKFSNLIQNIKNNASEYAQKEPHDLGQKIKLNANLSHKHNSELIIQEPIFVENQMLKEQHDNILKDHEQDQVETQVSQNIMSVSAIEEPVDIMDESVNKESMNLEVDIFTGADYTKKANYWMSAALGHQISNAYNSNILVSFGVDMPIGTNFEIYGLVGGSYRQKVETNGQALISKSYLDASAAGTTSFSLKDKHNVAEINYKHAFSGIAGAGLRYKLNTSWSIFGGMAYQNLFGVIKDPIIHTATYADGTPNAEVLYPEEILTNYELLYNHNALCQSGVSWAITQKLKIEGIFNYGIKPFIRHSLTKQDGRERMIGIQMRYIW